MGRRIADMEMRLTEQARLLADRERERDQLRTDVDSARRIEADLRQELAHHRAPPRRAPPRRCAPRRRWPRASSSARAKTAPSCSAKSPRMKREAEATWASERVENALLRERINDVAAEVARLTSVLEGPGSTIDTILAAPEHAAATNGAAKPATRRRRTPTARKARAASRIASAPCRRARRGYPPRRDRARLSARLACGADRRARCSRSFAQAEDREIAEAPRGRAQELHRRADLRRLLQDRVRRRIASGRTRPTASASTTCRCAFMSTTAPSPTAARRSPRSSPTSRAASPISTSR